MRFGGCDARDMRSIVLCLLGGHLIGILCEEKTMFGSSGAYALSLCLGNWEAMARQQRKREWST